MSDKLRDDKVELFIVQKLIHPHDVWMGGTLKDLKLILHQFNQDLMLVDLVFSDYFNCAFDVSTAMHSNSHLSKTALTEDSAYFVSLFDIGYFFEATEVFEVKNVLVSVTGH